LAKPIKLILNVGTVKPLSRFLEAILKTKFKSYGTPAMETSRIELTVEP
jgi:hypothetical protein